MHGRYPKAFVGEAPYKLMGFQPGDEKIMLAPLDWVGFHYDNRRIVSDAGGHNAPEAADSVERRSKRTLQPVVIH